ncbi:MAG TPA: hypothetical protein VKU02_34050, partial [Gemmataceae bacterium]|nr:hypothetical protein [Gemmataceae bacterium]
MEQIDAGKASPLETWAGSLVEYIKQSEDIVPKLRDLSQVPGSGTPAERLAALVQVWQQLGINDGVNNPLNHRAAQFVERVVGIRQEAETRFRDILGQLERGILAALKDGAQLPGHELILTSKWPVGSLLYFSGFALTTVGGPMRALHRNDPLWGLLEASGWTAEDFYQSDGPVLLLGPANWGIDKSPRGFYPLNASMELTRQRRQEQLDYQQKEERAKAERAREEDAAARRDPAWQIADARRRLAELENRQTD